MKHRMPLFTVGRVFALLAILGVVIYMSWFWGNA